ncbi:unnamed protein product [Callosobruchus maculatus]|nr:unnamed protein product [Callosobruchus maculatus]
MMGVPDDPGLTPRLCEKVFDYLRETAVGEEMRDLKVTVSFLEIYNEKVRDLLDGESEDDYVSKKRLPLKVREHPKRGPYVQGLREHHVTSPESLLYLLQKGDSHRRIASTLNNRRSSRSHSVFTVDCAGARLRLVDLAGSERAATAGKDRVKEGAHINRSLVALGNVISALAELSSRCSKRRFVPFRDSVLTWLLKDTLAGNSNTVMVATVSPSSNCYSETVNTLRFGQRAKLIIARPVIDEDPKEKTIRELREEIRRLRLLLEGGGVQVSPELPCIKSMSETSKLISLDSCSDLTNITNESIDSNVSPPEVVSQETNSTTGPLTQIETIVPLIDVKSTVKPTKPTQLKRTYSVDHAVWAMEKKKVFGSTDSLPSTSTVSQKSSSEKDSVTSNERSKGFLPPTQMRRRSINKSVPKDLPKRGSFESTEKLEKAVSTEQLASKKVESKVDSIRKKHLKPRSQIVAAVTSRLYNKVQKKDVSTDTSDLAKQKMLLMPKELTICSNARSKLRELTKKALKAHKNKTAETQTDRPVQRVKEISTDVNDLPVIAGDRKHVGIMADITETRNASVDCNLKRFNSESTLDSLSFTKTCGTQCSGQDKNSRSKGVSFTKYLRDIQPNLPPNPIYANSFSINISNNYVNGHKSNGSSSDNSLEETSQNTGLHTPDLLSNHNSSDPNVRDPIVLSHGTMVEEDHGFVSNEVFESLDYKKWCLKAHCIPTHKVKEKIEAINILKTHAPENVVSKSLLDEFCIPMPKFHAIKAVPQVIINDEKMCEGYVTMRQPLILKSIVRNEDDAKFKTETPDSLEYHMINKRVKFLEKKRESQRMFKAMSSFLEEATLLMSNIEKVTTPILNREFELEVNVNNIKGLGKCNKKHYKKKHTCNESCQTDSSRRTESCSQTFPPFRRDTSTQSEPDYSIPVNKYEALLEESLKKLENKISCIPSPPQRHVSQDFDDLFNPPEFEGNSDIEDSSLEGNNVTFSDYGSLPRRTHKRYRKPTCSPSEFLKQLTNMRKQVIKSSREDLMMNSSCSH